MTKRQSKTEKDDQSKTYRSPRQRHEAVDLDKLDQALLVDILNDATISTVALGQKHGLVRQTLSLRINNPTFKAELARLQRELQKDAITVLQEAHTKAARKMHKALDAKVYVPALKDWHDDWDNIIKAATWILGSLRDAAAELAKPTQTGDGDQSGLSATRARGLARFASAVAERKTKNTE